MLRNFSVAILYTWFKFCLLFKNLNARLNLIAQFYYSVKYCVIFNCKNCFFLRKINVCRGTRYFRIDEHTGFGKGAVLTAWDEYEGVRFSPKVTIGRNCSFGDYIHLTCINKIEIGNNVLTGRWVTITDNSHGTSQEVVEGQPPVKRHLYSKGAVIIDDNVWIGDKVTILPGVTIGKNTIIGANSVVTQSIPQYSVAAGNPAKIIKTIKK